jgi:hypothetical protein
MLDQIDFFAYEVCESIGVRLEDLKKRPEETLRALSNWMGIEHTESLYEMTMQGKKWWGDPSSPDYKKDGMEPFGKSSIGREASGFFSQQDRFILETLFYPFSVKFGYKVADQAKFEKDLLLIEPMLDELFKFEKEYIESVKLSEDQIRDSGYFKFFRAALKARWRTLVTHKTYDNLLTPLSI